MKERLFHEVEKQARHENHKRLATSYQVLRFLGCLEEILSGHYRPLEEVLGLHTQTGGVFHRDLPRPQRQQVPGVFLLLDEHRGSFFEEYYFALRCVGT